MCFLNLFESFDFETFFVSKSQLGDGHQFLVVWVQARISDFADSREIPKRLSEQLQKAPGSGGSVF